MGHRLLACFGNATHARAARRGSSGHARLPHSKRGPDAGQNALTNIAHSSDSTRGPGSATSARTHTQSRTYTRGLAHTGMHTQASDWDP